METLENEADDNLVVFNLDAAEGCRGGGGSRGGERERRRLVAADVKSFDEVICV